MKINKHITYVLMNKNRVPFLFSMLNNDQDYLLKRRKTVKKDFLLYKLLIFNYLLYKFVIFKYKFLLYIITMTSKQFFFLMNKIVYFNLLWSLKKYSFFNKILKLISKISLLPLGHLLSLVTSVVYCSSQFRKAPVASFSTDLIEHIYFITTT